MRSMLLVLAMIVVHVQVAAAVDVTACGQTVADGDTGVLQADLDCTGSPGVCVMATAAGDEVPCDSDVDCVSPNDACASAAVTLGNGSKLSMNGRTLTGGGVRCTGGTCHVNGPGTVTGAEIGIVSTKKVMASGVTLTSGRIGILSRRSGAILTGVTLTDNSSDGLISWQGTVKANDLVSTGNGGEGIYAKERLVFVRGGTVSNNGGNGIDGHPARAVGVTAQGNVGAGIISAKVVSVRDSTVTGNAVAAGGIDLHSQRRPRVQNTVCEHSHGGPNGTWGVCTID